MTEQAGEAVPASQRGSWTSFLKSIASFSGDLSSLTAPPFILSPVSLTEFPAYWCEHPELLAAIADASTEEDRALSVLKWFVSTLKGQYTSRNESMGSEKKPLNPVLGELFYGHWPSTASRGETCLLVEQVSHHPPITAYVIENKSRGIKLVGHNAQKTSFSGGSIIVKQIGHATLTIAPPSSPLPPSQYLITLPRLRIDGLWYGSPYIELAESSYIIGSTGCVTVLEYKGKGYFGGKSHVFKAVLTVPPPGEGDNGNGNGNGNAGGSGKNGKGKEWVVEGLWHTTSKVVSGGKGEVFHDVTGPKEEVTVKEREGGSAGEEMESRKLWGAVAKGIREGDFEIASREKGRIENEQRQRRRDEAAAGTTWELKHFARVESDPVYERLGKLVKIVPPTEDAYEFLENWPVELASSA